MLNGYAVLKVCYNNNNTRDSIKSVKAARFHSQDGRIIDIVGSIVSWSKSQIIGMITDKSEEIRVFTATIEEDKYLLGSELDVYIHDGQKYLRAKGSSATGDDLNDVPLYEAHC